MASNRKPYNDCAGYVASRHNDINGGWVVIYRAAEQGIDVGENTYATVCETHGTICGTTSIPKARPFLKIPEFCEQCMGTEPAEYRQPETLFPTAAELGVPPVNFHDGDLSRIEVTYPETMEEYERLRRERDAERQAKTAKRGDFPGLTRLVTA